MKLAAMFLALLTSSPALAQTVPSIWVRGDGEAEVAPDFIHVFASIASENKDTERAKQDVDRRMQAVMDAIESFKIERSDIVASGAHLVPTYEYDENRNEIPTGYRVTRTIELKLREISFYEQLIHALVSVGVDEIQNATSGLDDENALRRLALQDAAAAAKLNAVAIAQTLSVTVGDPIEISDERLVGPPTQAPWFETRISGETLSVASTVRNVTDPLEFIPENIKVSATVWVRFKVLPLRQ